LLAKSKVPKPTKFSAPLQPKAINYATYVSTSHYILPTQKVSVSNLLQLKRYTGWAKKVSYRTFSISSLNIDQLSQFFTGRLWKKFATRWHAHYT